ncbi:hypothetical protein ACN28S_67170 [Cystobacter fuscus]
MRADAPGLLPVIDGQSVCFDPPAYIVRVYGSALPAPECKTIDGQVACGYQCVTQFGKVQCAHPRGHLRRPQRRDRLLRSAPRGVRPVWPGSAPRRVQGLRLGPACGYKCTVGSGKVACNTTPMGVCKSDGLQLKCFDPPAQALCAWGKSLPALQCQSSDGHPVCGYGCVKAYAKAACASTPKGMCKVFDSEVHCFDPPSPWTRTPNA